MIIVQGSAWERVASSSRRVSCWPAATKEEDFDEKKDEKYMQRRDNELRNGKV
jgi:hypothetical protein